MNARRENEIAVVNSLGGTLLHYTEALRHTLEAAGGRVTVTTVFEPSASQNGRIAWIRDYIVAVWREGHRLRRDGGGTLIVTWPVLGYIDLALLRMLGLAGVRVGVVLHDPKPLVRAVGYSRFWRMLARSLFSGRPAIVHSSAAFAVLEEQGLADLAEVVPHPVLPVRARPSAKTSPRTAVRVLGQFKADRDLQLLAALPRSTNGFGFEIWGRGWPAVEGWEVHDGYVSEEELDALIDTAAVVLIPYKRFYQSGIAIRALESRTPFVGPRQSSLRDLYREDSPLLVDDTSDVYAWIRAVDAAALVTPAEMADQLDAAAAKSGRAWLSWSRQGAQ
ncbi:hypothetical protein ASF48_18170 [Rathayibacter sp. Leaf299]|uniref:hypothetical protein n=1 Tax=unclassified Rathayibacter TaxID=2609250 RepID=UPI0006FD737A|nr:MULTISPECIES: hypothetical protein [unclassified Rathayibacter]KQQ18581.1 hypothetical protein ASF48_18170 [Rathayibacter sp. Leaf299]